MALIRSDSEQALPGLRPWWPDDFVQRDWSVSWAERRLWNMAWNVLRLRRKARARLPPEIVPYAYTPIVPFVLRAYATLAHVNFRAGVRVLASAPMVVTDRLHAHILAVLLGIPHVAMNNNYGKVGAVYEAYTSRFANAHFAPDVEAALEMIASLRSAS